MSKLNVPNGDWTEKNSFSFRDNDGYFTHSIHDDFGECIAEARGNTSQEATELAILIADAGTTYNKCGLLPSELMQQNEELKEFGKELMRFKNEMYNVMSEALASPLNFQKALESFQEILTKHSKQ